MEDTERDLVDLLTALVDRSDALRLQAISRFGRPRKPDAAGGAADRSDGDVPVQPFGRVVRDPRAQRSLVSKSALVSLEIGTELRGHADDITPSIAGREILKGVAVIDTQR